MFPTQNAQALQQERQVCAARAQGTAGNRGGKKSPGQDRALSCLLLLSRFSDCKSVPPRLVSHRSDPRDRVLSSEPQKQGMRLGELVLGCPRSQTEVLCRCQHGVGLGSVTMPLPRHTQPQARISPGLCQAEQPRALPVQRASSSAIFSRSTCSGKA